MRQKILKTGGSIFLLFVFCTILSRGLYVFSMANVTVTGTKEYAINHSTTESGRIEAKNVFIVVAKAGEVIADILVQEGDRVTEGQALLKLDTEKLKVQILELDDQIKLLELQIQEAYAAEETRIKTENTTREYAQKVYEQTISDSDRNIENARINWENAKMAYESYGQEEEPEEQELERLEAEMHEQEVLYNSAIAEKETAKLLAEQTMQSANVEGASSTMGQQLSLQKDTVVRNRKELESLVQADGLISATQNGIVAQINVQTGEVTSENAVMLIANESVGYKIRVQIKPEQEKYIDINSDIRVRKKSEGEDIFTDDAVITAVNSSDDEIEAKTEVIVQLNDPDFSVGEIVEVEFKSETMSYKNCIPIQALHQEGEDTYYVYVIGKKKTILGEEAVAQKVPVKVIDKDAQFAAIETDTLSSDTKIVYSTDRTIDEGSAIRVKGSEDEE